MNYLIILILALKNIINRIYIVLSLINIIYLGFFYDDKITAIHYGGALAIIFLIFFFLESFIYTTYSLIKLCCMKNKNVTIILIPLLIMIAIIIFYLTKVNDSCINWDKSLVGDEIINE